MMMENADETIQHAQKQHKLAYRAKKQAFHELQESIDRRFGDDILDHYKVRNYAVEVSPSYESTAIALYLHILPETGYEETLHEINDSDIEEAYRLRTLYKRSIEDEIREMIVDDWDLETDIHIKVKTEEQFERLRK